MPHEWEGVGAGATRNRGPRLRPSRILVTCGLFSWLVACSQLDSPFDRPQEPAGQEIAAAPEPPPPTIGLDSAYLALAMEQASTLPRLHCLLVARHGQIEGERCFRGPGPNGLANVKSVSKSILSAVVGIAIAEGHLLGPDQPVLSFFSEYLSEDAARERAEITIGHLLTMQSGLERTSGSNYGRWVQSPNWVRFAITRPIVAPPGTQRLYSTGNSHLLSAIVTKATGRSTWEYSREKLAEPLGIRLPRWTADPQGIFFGGNEMRLTPRDMLRFGELYRNGGRFEGRQVVPEEWVRRSLDPLVRARNQRESYGYGWFIGRVGDHPMYYAWGYGGQYIFVIPDLELTVVTTSDPDDPRTQGHNQGIQRILRDAIVPAAELGG